MVNGFFFQALYFSWRVHGVGKGCLANYKVVFQGHTEWIVLFDGGGGAGGFGFGKFTLAFSFVGRHRGSKLTRISDRGLLGLNLISSTICLLFRIYLNGLEMAHLRCQILWILLRLGDMA